MGIVDPAGGVLPVIAGDRVSQWGGPIALAVAGVTAALVAAPLGQGGWVFWSGLAVLAATVAAVTVTRSRRPFPALALATAFFAIAWLASLPRT